MKSTLLILAFMATSTALIPAHAGPAAMTNNTIQAMLAGGVPVPTIVHAIKTAAKIDLYVNDREIIGMKNAGASSGDVKQILEAIHYREYFGIDRSPAESEESVPVPAARTALPAPASAPDVNVAAWVPAVAPVTNPAPAPPVNVPSVPASFAPNPAGAPIGTPNVPSSIPASPAAPVPVSKSGQRLAPGSTVYVDTNNGFDIFIMAAFRGKHVPVKLVNSPDSADYVLDSSLFHSAGAVSTKSFATTTRLSEAAFSLTSKSGVVVWAYAATKGSFLGGGGKQSVAEACAKHVMNDLFK